MSKEHGSESEVSWPTRDSSVHEAQVKSREFPTQPVQLF
jgi:hypothetical protein